MKNHMKALNMHYCLHKKKKASPAASEPESPLHFLMITVKCWDPKKCPQIKDKGCTVIKYKNTVICLKKTVV